MLIFVVIFNLVLTLFNLYIVLRLWKLRRLMVRITETLTRLEECIHSIFYNAPQIVFQGQTGTHRLRQSYQSLELQIQQLQKVLALVTLGVRIWQRQSIYSKQSASVSSGDILPSPKKAGMVRASQDRS